MVIEGYVEIIGGEKLGSFEGLMLEVVSDEFGGLGRMAWQTVQASWCSMKLSTLHNKRMKIRTVALVQVKKDSGGLCLVTRVL